MRTVEPGGLAIDARDLTKTYAAGRGKQPVRALDGLTLAVPSGQVFGLLGPNGAGKSTTVKILTTLARPDSGTATVDGLDVRRDSAAVRHRIGLVSQKPGADPVATGRENLTLAGRIQGMTGRQSRRRADELLERFGLTEAAHRLARTYSGGMARKLDVALGLVHRPSVLFLDEPTTGLDPEARSELWQELQALASVDRMTVLLTTHYLDEADHLADRLAIVDHGRVVTEGSPEELKGELRGDRITLDLDDAALADRAVACLGSLETLRDLAAEGRTVRARADHGGRAVPVVLARLEQAGIPVASAAVSRPSLDDVYLAHAGRTFEEAA
ncbi:MAG TPA: ATP-binding cassette domain-containing protein [Segeticoccus sp.]|jgi:ABC-2 type transport system ATP-binding protein|nr:ATP-binding cassette domain-containing protein [Segeticoccus sp.]